MLEKDNQSVFYKRRLPHLYQQNHPIFITWRLNYDLPEFMKKHMFEMKREFEITSINLSDDFKALKEYNLHKRVFDWYDEQIGISKDFPDLLKQKQIADIIVESLYYHNNQKYSLHSFCIMPNHVHVLITPYANQADYKKTLSSITQTWKRFTARKINLELGQTGSFWEKESYDHLVRNETEFMRIINYILQNPVKAKLVNNWKEWQYSWIAEELTEVVA